MPKIMFTGGGSAGHVSVNLALIPKFEKDGWSIVYVGSEKGIEKSLVATKNIRYIGISSGKLRRYFDLKNFSDPFRVLRGAFQAVRVVRKEKPNVLFSKGGFVSVPVVVGAWLNRVPIIIHESDLTPGLANRLSMRFAKTICTTFKESEKYLPEGKTRYVGAIVREELLKGDADRGRVFCNFATNKPVLVIMGGSLGARKINQTVRAVLDKLTQSYNIVHLCGKGNVDTSLTASGYRQYEYLDEPLPDVLAMADVVVSRAGSNSIFELLHLQKPMLLIPLTKEQSRGDQILNAKAFESAGFSRVLEEEEMNSLTLPTAIDDVYEHRESFIQNMEKANRHDTLTEVFEFIKQVANK